MATYRRLNLLAKKVSEAEERFHKANEIAFNYCKEYKSFTVKVAELREEWLGLCGVMKAQNIEAYGHLTGLILLKQRVHDEYRDARLTSLRMLKRCAELLAEVNSTYKKLISKKKHLSALKKLKEEEICAKAKQ